MDTMRAGPAAKYAITLLVLAIAAPAARANTYLFSFTTQDLMNALAASRGQAEYQDSAYYAIFLQPNPAQAGTFTIGSVNTPNPTDANKWDTQVITDPSNPYFGYSTAHPCTSDCSWAAFYKDSSLPDVTIVSGNAYPYPNGSNYFLGNDWFDQGTAPYSWGGQDSNYNILYDQVMNTVMSKTDVWSFTINTSQTLSGTITLEGYASALISGSPSTMYGVKDDTGLGFTMTFSIPTPEPGTWASMLAGVVLMSPLILRSKRRHSLRKTQSDSSTENATR